jgi:hypothetical protein
MLDQGLIWAGASLAMLSWLGAWAEVILLKRFSRAYFAFGPVLLNRVVRISDSAQKPQLHLSLVGLPRLMASQVDPGTVLIRRRSHFLVFWLDIPPIWSARIRVSLRTNGNSGMVSLEVRHGISWVVFVLVPALSAVVVLILQPSATFLLFTSVCVVLFVAPVWASVRAAVRDGERVWAVVESQLSTRRP